jgi:flavin reductase (DIM6/NTAB) family NADH-FMN oxidoreductase RutF
MNKKRVTPDRPVYPTPAALVTSVDAEGRPNIITLGEVFNISIAEPVILGIAIRKQRWSHGLISRTREYVVNLPTCAIADKVWLCGSVSGREVDKFARAALTPLPAAVVRPPLIAECPVNIECRVIGIQEIGDHDLFLGEAVAQHVDDEVLGPGGRIDAGKLDGFALVQGEFWSFGRRL